jgi:phosphopantetheine adenylyltransferase
VNALTEKLALRDWLYNTLTAAQDERHLRQAFVDGELAWIVYERETMHTAVNQARAERGLPALPIESIERVEMQATGHVDYTKKFALYCAELALEQQ